MGSCHMWRIQGWKSILDNAQGISVVLGGLSSRFLPSWGLNVPLWSPVDRLLQFFFQKQEKVGSLFSVRFVRQVQPRGYSVILSPHQPDFRRWFSLVSLRSPVLHYSVCGLSLLKRDHAGLHPAALPSQESTCCQVRLEHSVLQAQKQQLSSLFPIFATSREDGAQSGIVLLNSAGERRSLISGWQQKWAGQTSWELF